MDIIDTINQEHTEILAFLNEKQEITYANNLNKYFAKTILLSSASFFEHKIQEILIDFTNSVSNNDARIAHFLKKGAIHGKYHTLFDWGKQNQPSEPEKKANKFFSYFGEDFKKEMEKAVKENSKLDDSIQAFLEIGHLRNILVHNNFAAYNFDTKTPPEIYELHQRALYFIEILASKFKPNA